jgi:plasmid stabilization system protein ParE
VRQLELSVDADADLFDLLAYGTAVHGVQASDAYYDGLIEAFDLICRHPGIGPAFDEEGLKLRRWLYRQHRKFYRADDARILIVRVLHVSSDAVRWLLDLD